MLQNLTEEQIVQLAPDAASVKAGKGLAVKSKWPLLHFSQRAVWGHCQGSGKNPYQTVVDMNEIAFRCSCPSRKFPCKHGLGLLLLYAAHPELFSSEEEPDWVSEWLSKREAKAEKKEQKAKSDKPVDEEAQARRAASRHKKVLDGIDDLQIWIKDLLRNGLLNVPERAYSLFDNIARRMVDAQATGLVNRLRAIQEIDFYKESWKYILTDRLSKLYLLSESYRHIDAQPEDWKWEIRTQIGYPQSKEEVLAGEGVRDEWMVVHRRVSDQNGVRMSAYWLYGKESRRFAVYLDFTAPGKLPDFNLLPGSTYSAEICYYKGVAQIRGLLRDYSPSDNRFMPKFCHDLDEATSLYRKTMRENPFVEEIPMLVDNLRIASKGKDLYLLDAAGKAVVAEVDDAIKTDILAITGGKPFSVFILAGNVVWQLKSIWSESEFYSWKDEIN